MPKTSLRCPFSSLLLYPPQIRGLVRSRKK
jgi:hypothetical protein